MKEKISKDALIKISPVCFEIPQKYRQDMRVPARIFVSEEMLEQVLLDSSLEQIINVTTLPGIQKFAVAMPDIHEGYGFPIGGVAAMDIHEDGVISPGGIGYDINCGVRLLASNLSLADIKNQLPELAEKLFKAVPSGAGRSGSIILNNSELNNFLTKGAQQALALGYGLPEDLEHCEENGCFIGADASFVSDHAKNRGKDQLGTLGSGNHFLEVQVVEDIFDQESARAFNLSPGQVTIMIHCGSRGLGHQVCTDYVASMLSQQNLLGFKLVDRQLACAPFDSSLGQAYFSAMKCAANFAFANRHIIGHRVREAFLEIFGSLGKIKTIYDVCHNVGKLETHKINNKNKQLIVHRKGATRAFGPASRFIPKSYKQVGQPVLIPGTMGTASYVLAGLNSGLSNSFGSSCHGAGRTMSRMHAKKIISGRILKDELLNQNIIIKCDSDRGLAEEAPVAYKNIDNVIQVVESAGLAKRVARLRPVAVIKGD